MTLKKIDKIMYKYFKDKYEKRKRKPCNKKIAETRTYLLVEIKHNDLNKEKHKNVSMVLNYFEHFLVFVSAVSGCVSISAFASLVGVPKAIFVSSTVGLKIYVIAARIKKYKSITKKNHDKIVSLAKTKLITIKVFVSKTLINSCINHEFLSVNMLRERNEMIRLK